MARLHSTSVEHLQGTHQVSVEAEKGTGGDIRRNQGSSIPPSFDRLRSCYHVKTARRRHCESGVAPCKVEWLQSRI